MAIVKIGDQINTYIAHQADTDYLLEAGTEVTTESAYGIDADFGQAANRTLLINGMVSGAQTGVTMSYASGITGNSITVGESGFIDAEGMGIILHGDAAAITNNGIINVTGNPAYGIYLDGDGGTISNSGGIFTADGVGIALTGAGNTVINSGDIYAGTFGINAILEGTKLVNSGTITGESRAYYGSTGADMVINRGTLSGAVDLYGGNDVFRSKGGHVNGVVTGGDGDDRFYIDDRNIDLQELGGQGWDKVYSSVSWSVGDGFEEALLTGKANARLTGNDFGTFLTGNAGNNRIIGHLGGDKITGGRGNDMLTGDDGLVAAGAGGPDIFVFKHPFRQGRHHGLP